MSARGTKRPALALERAPSVCRTTGAVRRCALQLIAAPAHIDARLTRAAEEARSAAETAVETEAALDAWIEAHAVDEEKLATLVPIAARAEICVDAAMHLYFVAGEAGARGSSVTRFIDSVFPPFNRCEVYERMIHGRAWPKPKYRVPDTTVARGYRGMTQGEVFSMWAAAAPRGKRLHRWIELALNAVGLLEAHAATAALATIPRTQEVTAFISWFTAARETAGMTLLALELPIFDDVLNGTLDALVLDASGEPWVLDWKCEDELDAGQWERCAAPVAHLWANKLTKHALQLNTYAFILEQERYATLVPRTIVGLRIVQIYPRTEKELAAGVAVLKTHVLCNTLRGEVRAMRRCEAARLGLAHLPEPITRQPRPPPPPILYVDEEPVEIV